MLYLKSTIHITNLNMKTMYFAGKCTSYHYDLSVRKHFLIKIQKVSLNKD